MNRSRTVRLDHHTGTSQNPALLLTNRPEFIEAGNRLGEIVVPVNFRSVGEEIAYIFTDSGASAVISQPYLGLAGKGAAALQSIGNELPYVVIDKKATASRRNSSV